MRIENFADVGYDETNIFMANYDWRLSFHHLEERDHYFSNLKMNMEHMYRHNGNRANVIVTHSMGTPVCMYFLKWVESEKGGNGGKDWVSKHVKSVISVGGVFAGVPKVVSSILSGETKDTAFLDPFVLSIKDVWLPAHQLSKFFQSLGSLGSMLPKGGDLVWGDSEGAIDDREQNISFGTLLDMKWRGGNCMRGDFVCKNRKSEFEEMIPDCERKSASEKNYTVEGTMDLLREKVAPKLMKKMDRWYEFGYYEDEDLLEANAEDPRAWTNPFATQLPNAPDLEIYCTYGIGFNTERGYFYTNNQNYGCENDVPFVIDTSIVSKESNYTRGVQVSDGDGTVPLLSLAFPCVNTWKKKKYNPHGVKVYVREFEQENISMVEGALRFTSKATEHVDIIGNFALIQEILKIASNHPDRPQTDRIFSDIHKISERFEERLKKREKKEEVRVV